jgi:hypothetical protein
MGAFDRPEAVLRMFDAMLHILATVHARSRRIRQREMSDAGTQRCPIAKIQRRLRRDEAMIEMARAERIFLASRGRPSIPATPEAICRLVEIGLGAPSK